MHLALVMEQVEELALVQVLATEEAQVLAEEIQEEAEVVQALMLLENRILDHT